jgi:hypothetical protein
MTSTSRQNNLLIAQDWTKIYQSFRNADFQSYDFENLRRTMIDYIRTNYPEDYNDYIESSEYLALIDLIAFLGQSISYRIDLNARDNFLELSERRDSILRLARLVAYNAQRNNAASGLLKFTSVQTTEDVLDSSGRNLSNQTIAWNDSSNTNWYDQFISVMNAAFPTTQKFGNPSDSANIYGVPTQQYRFNSKIAGIPVFNFSKVVSGQSMNFEITSTTFSSQNYIYEESPKIGNPLACVYKDDGRGAGSSSNGFFLHFTQGTLNQGSFTIDQPNSHESVDIDTPNINNTDVWLYSVNKTGVESDLWTQVPALQGNNIIYNSINQQIKNIYAVITRTGDTVSLQFSNGIFGKLPVGTFKVYYRVSNNLDYTINPADLSNITISFPYTSATNQSETLTINLSLSNSVSNASASESNASIQANAPQSYYTQNRMITAEDYNISPLSASTQVLKIQAVNRVSSGISRYFDLIDPSGQYSSTTLFGSDGIVYTEKYLTKLLFTYLTKVDIQGTIYNDIFTILKDSNLRNFYYGNYQVSLTASLNIAWYQKTADRTMSTGYIGGTTNSIPIKVGDFTATNLQYLQVGALVQFTAPTGYYFDTTNYNIITAGTATVTGAVQSIWAECINLTDDGTASGTGLLSTGFGPIGFNKEIPTGAIVTEIIPTWNTTIGSSIITKMVDLIFSNQPFGLTYNSLTRAWQIIYETNLNAASLFSLSKQGDTTNTQTDASWLLLFTTDNVTYTVSSRQQRYVFESSKQISFYFDNSKKIYDSTNNTVVKDQITVLSINNQPSSLTPFTIDKKWDIVDSYLGLDGFKDNSKLVVSFAENETNGSTDNPDSFRDIVYSNSVPSYIVQERYTITEGQEDYRYVKNDGIVKIFLSQSYVGELSQYTDGQYFYFIDTDTVKKFNAISSTFLVSLDYKVYAGRDDLKFQYVHNADYESRVDPGSSNIVDIYVLTKSYDTYYRQWISGAINSEPLPPSSAELFDLLDPKLNLVKSISDEIVYHPVKYTPLFGTNADPSLQAMFQVIKTPGQVISDNDVQTRVISAINQFFALENWNFGDTFYFTELSTYVMNQLTPYISTFLIVPKQGTQNFGSLFEISSTSNQLFISTATVEDVVIISGVTATSIKAIPGTIVSSNIASSQVLTSSTYGI